MNRRTLGIAAAILLGGLLVFRVAQAVRSRLAPAQTELPPAAVTTAVAGTRTIVRSTGFSGVVRPRNEVDVFPRLPGRVQSVAAQVGDRVRAGQALAVIEHREIALQVQAAQAAHAQAAANAEIARTQFERFETLRASGSVAPAEYERVATGHRLAQAGLLAAEAQLGLAREALANATIIAPVAGTVTRRTIDVGQQVGPQQPAFQVQDVRSLKVVGSVAAADAPLVTAGAAAIVRVEELPGAGFAGTVLTLSPTLDPQTRRAAIEIDLGNPGGRLMPNMFAAVTIELERRDNVVAVPRAAVVADAAGRTVWQVRDDRAVALRPELGLDDGDWIEVRRGIDAGDVVVVAGQTDLSDGRSVAPTAP